MFVETKRSLGLPIYDASNAVEELKKSGLHSAVQMGSIKDAQVHFYLIDKKY